MKTLSSPLAIPLDDMGIEPVTLAAIKARAALNQPPISERPLQEAREALEKAQAQLTDKPSALVDDVNIPVPSGKVGVRLIRPSGVLGKRPVVVYLHGGGWVLGSPDTHDRLGRDLAAASGAAVAMVRYARSPEARHPEALEQAYAVCEWLAEHSGAVGLDASRLAVAGDSAGANIAAAVALLAKRRNGPAIRQQVLIYPVVDASCSLPSCFEFENGPNLTRSAMQWYWDQYAPDADQKNADTATLLNASPDDLTGLPPALIITAEFDVLRDEGEAYARKLIQAGVAVTATRMLGTIHGFMANNALAQTPACRACVTLAGSMLREALK